MAKNRAWPQSRPTRSLEDAREEFIEVESKYNQLLAEYNDIRLFHQRQEAAKELVRWLEKAKDLKPNNTSAGRWSLYLLYYLDPKQRSWSSPRITIRGVPAKNGVWKLELEVCLDDIGVVIETKKATDANFGALSEDQKIASVIQMMPTWFEAACTRYLKDHRKRINNLS